LLINCCGYQSVVLRNICLFVLGGINHDPELFEDPETFNPDRYLRSEYGTKPGVDVTDFRHTIMFGAGRVGYVNAVAKYLPLMAFHSQRICAGMQLANNSLVSHGYFRRIIELLHHP